jgi:hypothetical protein
VFVVAITGVAVPAVQGDRAGATGRERSDIVALSMGASPLAQSSARLQRARLDATIARHELGT